MSPLQVSHDVTLTTLLPPPGAVDTDIAQTLMEREEARGAEDVRGGVLVGGDTGKEQVWLSAYFRENSSDEWAIRDKQMGLRVQFT